MSATLEPGVDMAGIATMHRRERPAQAILIGGHQDQVNMVGHENPRPDLDARVGAVRAEQIAVERVILVAEEGLGTTIAPLRDMMRVPREDRACQASQMAWLSHRCGEGN